MKLYITSLIRYKKFGHIYEINFPKKVEKKKVVESNEGIPKHGGPHGISWLKDEIVTGTYGEIKVFDKRLNLKKEFSHRFLSGVHGINAGSKKIWVSSCNNEGVICFNRNGNVEESHFLTEREDLMRLAGREPIRIDRSTDFRRERIPYEDQPFHVNDVQRTDAGLEVSLHKLGMVYDLYRREPVVRIPSNDIHDGRTYGHKAFINDTGRCRVVKVSVEEGTDGRVEGQCQIDVMGGASLRTRLGILLQKGILKVCRGISRALPERLKAEYNCNANWLRGLLVVDDHHVLVGMSPAAVALVDLRREEMVDFLQLSRRLCEAVFAIAPGRPPA